MDQLTDRPTSRFNIWNHVAQTVKFENMIYDSSGICRGREGKETGGDMACFIGIIRKPCEQDSVQSTIASEPNQRIVSQPISEFSFWSPHAKTFSLYPRFCSFSLSLLQGRGVTVLSFPWIKSCFDRLSFLQNFPVAKGNVLCCQAGAHVQACARTRSRTHGKICIKLRN